MKICAIISGGTYSPMEQINKASFIIACDKGIAYAQKENITPDLLIGDYDSYDGEIPKGIPRIDLPVEKDDTDTHAAMKWALKEGFDEVWLYCALGGRLDHLTANIQSCTMLAEKGIIVRVFDETNNLIFISNGSITLDEDPTRHLSLLSVTDRCEHVFLKNAKWELSDQTLTNNFPVGTSNEWKGSPQISVGDGVLMIALCKGADHLNNKR